jgi:hypothetical protein
MKGHLLSYSREPSKRLIAGSCSRRSKESRSQISGVGQQMEFDCPSLGDAKSASRLASLDQADPLYFQCSRALQLATAGHTSLDPAALQDSGTSIVSSVRYICTYEYTEGNTTTLDFDFTLVSQKPLSSFYTQNTLTPESGQAYWKNLPKPTRRYNDGGH